MFLQRTHLARTFAGMAIKKQRPTPPRLNAAKVPPLENAVAIFHEMRRQDGFEETAKILTELVHQTSHKCPGQPRALFFTVEGHRNEEGGLDHAAWELVNNFIPNVLTPFLSEYSSPYARMRMNTPQREDPPVRLEIFQGEEEALVAGCAMFYDADTGIMREPEAEQVPNE